jgi:hypothetical protein
MQVVVECKCEGGEDGGWAGGAATGSMAVGAETTRVTTGAGAGAGAGVDLGTGAEMATGAVYTWRRGEGPGSVRFWRTPMRPLTLRAPCC